MSNRQIVLCFDGTGNTFRTDGTDTNVLKICRMLEKSDEQPGIGTEITPGSLASTTIQKRGKLDNSKVLNLALGRSFDRHVLGGYRFLMRHYQAGAKVYIFGFSRGAYTARFLNEMLDYVGLLGPDNEEVVPFIWDAFVSWKLGRTDNNREEKRKAFRVMKDSREILSRPMARVHFLGMFDAVNSIADFEVNVDGSPSSKVVRHAVSIDERRIKFRPVLLRSHKDKWVRKTSSDEKTLAKETSTNDFERTSGPPILPEIPNISPTSMKREIESDNDDDDDDMQDIEEMWFPGGHADIGGGWNLGSSETWPLTHAPLVWMVQEARRAGLRLNPYKLKQHECIEESDGDFNLGDTSNPKKNVPSLELPAAHKDYLEALHLAGTQGHIHDLLAYGNDLPLTSVLSWRLMEYLPLRRMELQADGMLKAVRWPPPRGQTRDIPATAQIHVSAIERMKLDPSYRPDNLIFGSSERKGDTGRAVGIGNWVVHSHEGDPVRERYVRR
ncbi:hypothetical protein LT330_008641 [Penicillium expansum]|uniref:T6SS Phospholipase effector Tle1-like catalytic domain-containing protein n=1 Tax=Penicillium expansum TaxID=27334 RepID=A0A0A2KL69_PENEN|nr:protein of unknown function DUF2235 [Penicillium expansum]KAK4866300.1 hypothetical protein LT330_008641 [Penicillium expansum]KGO46403.1 protein of unknown function DUF2235 [Penicillium expansum]KGO52497.1 protein of unknown function DUF2235 [Penicillium expansum]KGO68577.1 protein of unknown function DUF2235 [Penicillium expansum]